MPVDVQKHISVITRKHAKSPGKTLTVVEDINTPAPRVFTLASSTTEGKMMQGRFQQFRRAWWSTYAAAVEIILRRRGA